MAHNLDAALDESAEEVRKAPAAEGTIAGAPISWGVCEVPGRGWCVLEQDTILTEEPRGDGPVADVWASAEYLRSVLRRTR